MKTSEIQTLEGMVPYVQEHLLPHIKEAVEICMDSYRADPFNDMWTFGTHFWKNLWNRFKAVAEGAASCPFEVYGNDNEYKLKLGHYILRHHRIHKKSRLPTGARAAKSAGHQIQLYLFNDWPTPPERDNIIIAIDADTDGLKEVFIGEIMPLELDSKKFRWVDKASVFLAEGTEESTTADVMLIDDIYSEKTMVNEEEIVEVKVRLDESMAKSKYIESEGGK